MLIVFLIIYDKLQIDDSQNWLAPAHFYYNGNLYMFRGHTTYMLPNGFEFSSATNNVKNAFTGLDFDGNVDGYVYMNEKETEIAYFRWKNWDEAVDGKEPYLLFYREEGGA